MFDGYPKKIFICGNKEEIQGTADTYLEAEAYGCDHIGEYLLNTKERKYDLVNYWSKNSSGAYIKNNG